MDSELTNQPEQPKIKNGISPLTAILIAVALSLFISAINLIIFIRSDMYKKVRLIQNPEQVLSGDELVDITTPLSSKDLETIKKDIDTQFELLRDDEDFSIYDVSEVTLGI